MNCPYCEKPMLYGKLLGDQKRLRWLPDDKKMLRSLWAAGGLRIGSKLPLQRAETLAHFCSYCRKIVIDVDDC